MLAESHQRTLLGIRSQRRYSRSTRCSVIKERFLVSDHSSFAQVLTRTLVIKERFLVSDHSRSGGLSCSLVVIKERFLVSDHSQISAHHERWWSSKNASWYQITAGPVHGLPHDRHQRTLLGIRSQRLLASRPWAQRHQRTLLGIRSQLMHQLRLGRNCHQRTLLGIRSQPW